MVLLNEHFMIICKKILKLSFSQAFCISAVFSCFPAISKKQRIVGLKKKARQLKLSMQDDPQ